MSSNLIVKLAVPAALLVVVVLAVGRCTRDDPETWTAPPPMGGDALSPEAAEAIGMEADTETDVVRTLIVNVREQSDRLAAMEEANRLLREDNARLRDMRQGIVDEVSGTVAELGEDLRREARADRDAARDEVAGVAGRLERLFQGGGRSRRDGTAPGFMGRGADEDRLVWTDALGEGGDGASLVPWQRGAQAVAALEGEEEVAPPRPVYTVPKNSTLVGATAFTALIGRVPVGEEARVTDPYGFKLRIGRDNLAANGHEIPQIAYAVVSGQAIGDWTLGCVSGDVTSMTFVFVDGRIVTIPRAGDVAAGGTTRGARLGTLSDDYGNPCVGGRRVTNAASYLAQSLGALTLGAAAEGAAAAETTTVAGAPAGGGAATVVDGDIGSYAAGRGLAGAAREVARWVLERQAQEYDVVYVPPGARVAVHVEEELRIDYDPTGRLVNHEDPALAGGFRALD